MTDLAAWLAGRRWFRSKGRRVVAVEERDRAPAGGPPFAIVAATLEDGAREEYVLAGDEPRADLEAGALAAAILRAIDADARIPTGRGALRFVRGPAFAGAEVERASALAAEQSNTSIRIDDRYVLKIFRKVELGVNPELEVLGFLSAETSFRHAPQLAGAVEYEGGPLPATLAVLETFVPSEGDAWAWALAARRGAAAWRRLGEVTAELHAALASRADVAAFAPEDVAAQDLAAWAAGIEALADRAFALARRAGVAAGDLERAVRERARAIAALDPAGLRKTRIHGDYHLGQVLRTEAGDFAIFDFEGEPARPIAERRRKASPLRDVAGMLRSFGYAAHVGKHGPAWEAEARAAFLEGYGLRDVDRALLSALEVEKAVYEVAYELDNRPAWVEVPLAALRRLAGAGA